MAVLTSRARRPWRRLRRRLARGWRRRRTEWHRRRVVRRRAWHARRRYGGAKPSAPAARGYVREIGEFWRRHYGRDVDPTWHLGFEALGMGRDPRFVPGSEWWAEILPFLNDGSYREAYRDKNLALALVDPKHAPRTVLARTRGHWRGAGFETIPRDEAARRLVAGPADLVAKPARADNGAGVRRLAVEDGALVVDGRRAGLDALEAAYVGDDFVVQERVAQHEAMAAVHPASVNTVRMVTLRFAGEIAPLLALVRFGAGGLATDNVATGGVFCGVDAAGRLRDHARDRQGGRVERHPDTGHDFAKPFVVPGFEAIRAEACRLHERIHPFDFVSWDFAVGPAGEPVFIEMNFRGLADAYQVSMGAPLFGERTAAVLEAVRDARAARGRGARRPR